MNPINFDQHLPSPWRAPLAITRSMVAIAQMAMLVFTPTRYLLLPDSEGAPRVNCSEYRSLSAFCHAPGGNYELARVLLIIGLAFIASGLVPRVTAPLHLWITYSIYHSIPINEGGDQLALCLSVMFLFTCLGDRRIWQWSSSEDQPGTYGRWLAWIFIFCMKVQISILYFQASVAKMGHAEWQDGTALWYYMNSPFMGATGLVGRLTELVCRTPVGVATLTWMPLIIELLLCFCFCFRGNARRIVLLLGVVLHLSISFTMGLWSFSVVMIAADLIRCVPSAEWSLQWIRPALWRSVTRTPGSGSTSVKEGDVELIPS